MSEYWRDSYDNWKTTEPCEYLPGEDDEEEEYSEEYDDEYLEEFDPEDIFDDEEEY